MRLVPVYHGSRSHMRVVLFSQTRMRNWKETPLNSIVHRYIRYMEVDIGYARANRESAHG
jgi:hypothetical protein